MGVIRPSILTLSVESGTEQCGVIPFDFDSQGKKKAAPVLRGTHFLIAAFFFFLAVLHGMIHFQS